MCNVANELTVPLVVCSVSTFPDQSPYRVHFWLTEPQHISAYLHLCQWVDTLASLPETLLSSEIWPWHSVEVHRFCGSSVIQGSFFKRKPQWNGIVTKHTGSHSEFKQNAETFSSVARKFQSLRDAAHLSHDSSFNCQTDSKKYYYGSYKSRRSFLFS